MYFRQSITRTSTTMSIRSVLNNFLDRINYNNIYQLPYNSNAQILAAQERNGGRVQGLTGKSLVKRNVGREARRLRLHNRYLINLATDYIWNLHSTSSRRDRFINLANNANHINQTQISRVDNATIIDLMVQITVPQITNSSFEHAFFNGASFP